MMPFVPPAIHLRPSVCYLVNVRPAAVPSGLLIGPVPPRFSISAEVQAEWAGEPRWSRCQQPRLSHLYLSGLRICRFSTCRLSHLQIQNNRDESKQTQTFPSHYSLNDTVKLLFAEDYHMQDGAHRLYANTGSR